MFTVQAGPPAPVTSHTVTPPSPDGSSGWYVATPTVSVLRDLAGLTYFGLFSQPTSTYLSNLGSPYAFGLSQGAVTYGYLV